MTAFSKWLEQKFLEWEHSSARRKTLNEFSDYLGISRPVISMWMNGKRSPSAANVEVLADTFGDEIYDVLNLPRPDPLLTAITARWPKIPPEKQRKLAADAARYETQANQKAAPAPKRRKSQTDP